MLTLKYRRIVEAFASTLWAVRPDTLAQIRDVLLFQASGGKLDRDEIRELVGLGRLSARSYLVPLEAASGDASMGSDQVIAVLRVRGIIAHHIEQVDDISGPGGTSVERLQARFRAARDDPHVSAIVLDIDSPGGSVQGVPELAAEIADARGSKPIVAHANTLAASAAYWIGSAADEFVMAPSGDVGSIGVFAAHEDVSAALEAEGVKVTLIHAGKHKVEGNPFEPLADEARAAIQHRVDQVYEEFVAAVAANRGVPSSTVRGGYGEGRALGARDALELGMVDGIETIDDTIQRVAEASRPSRPPPRGRRANHDHRRLALAFR